MRQAIAVLTEHLGETPVTETARMMGRLATIYRDEKLTANEAKLRLATYCDLLADIPPDLMAEAFKRAGRRCRFFPTVAELREQVAHDLAMRQWRLGRARHLVDVHERDWRPEPEPISDQERAAVAKAMGELARSMSAGPALTPEEIEAREIHRAELIERLDREMRPAVDM